MVHNIENSNKIRGGKPTKHNSDTQAGNCSGTWLNHDARCLRDNRNQSNPQPQAHREGKYWRYKRERNCFVLFFTQDASQKSEKKLKHQGLLCFNVKACFSLRLKTPGHRAKAGIYLSKPQQLPCVQINLKTYDQVHRDTCIFLKTWPNAYMLCIYVYLCVCARELWGAVHPYMFWSRRVDKGGILASLTEVKWHLWLNKSTQN